MKSYSEVSPGVQTVYRCPASPLTKFAKVATVLTALASQTENTVTFGSVPVAGATVEILYGDDIVIPPAAYTVTGNGGAVAPLKGSIGITLFLNITAVTGTSPTLAVKVQVYDIVSGTWQDVPGAAFAGATAISQQTLTIFPGVIAVANVAVNRLIQNLYRCVYTIGGTTPSFTFSVGAQA